MANDGIFYFDYLNVYNLRYCISSIKEIESCSNYDDACLKDVVLEEKTFYIYEQKLQEE